MTPPRRRNTGCMKSPYNRTTIVITVLSSGKHLAAKCRRPQQEGFECVRGTRTRNTLNSLSVTSITERHVEKEQIESLPTGLCKTNHNKNSR